MDMSEGEQLKSENSRRPIGPWASWWLRAEPWPLLVFALALMLGYFWAYRSPTVAKVGLAYRFDFCHFFFFGMLAAGRGVQLAVRKSIADDFGVDPRAFQPRRRFWSWLCVIAALTILMLWLELPMHISFLFSRPRLDAIADEELSEPANVHLLAGQWGGLYRVSGVEVIGNTVVLYIDKHKGRYGFARVPGAVSEVVLNIPGMEENPYFHRDFSEQDSLRDPVAARVAGDWFVVYSSYWRVKVGWS